MSWLEPLYDADQMRALDGWAIERRGVPSLELMTRAGTELARVVETCASDGPVRIVCGKGNNAGDGIVAARLLSASGHRVELLLLFGRDELSQDAKACFDRLPAAVAVVEVDDGRIANRLEASGVVVDALLGTGFSGDPREPIGSAVAAINDCDCPVVAVDIPSGVNASSGEVQGVAVEATRTVSFGAQKLGLWVNPGKSHAGLVEVVDIGIPLSGDRRPATPTAGLIGEQVLGLLPRRQADGNKFRSGSVLIVGGSTGLTGAACLASEAAMRAGAGWARVAIPASLNDIFEIKLTEVMSLPVPDAEGHLAPAARAPIAEAAKRADTIAIGPGLGRSEGSFALARELCSDLDLPLVLDADGLNAVAESGVEQLAARSATTVLTPHSGEAARLLGTNSAAVDAQRLVSARDLSSRSGSVVVLKGDDTIVADARSDRVAVSRGGSPALATAGTGDVLTGITTAFLARGTEPFEAACVAVCAHVAAGRLAAVQHGVDSVIAGDVVDQIGAALSARP